MCEYETVEGDVGGIQWRGCVLKTEKRQDVLV
jgi:hypothetical protein